MTFQYFFFDTYLGNFLQILPIALLVGIINSLSGFTLAAELRSGNMIHLTFSLLKNILKQ